VYFHDRSDTHPALKQHPNVQDITPWLTDQMMILYNHIRHENPYALSYEMLYDVVKNYERQGIDVPELTLVFYNRPDLDQRRYNDPGVQGTTNIAIILEGALSIEQCRRAISVCRADRPDGGSSWIYLKQ
jgi:hypothetical protein